MKGTVLLVRDGGQPADKADVSNAVVWLKPDQGSRIPGARSAPGKFEMRQQHKRFEPHMLAVPAGSTVSFPNLDPFFHNVFSMFDGRRFDLGLYEAGASHSVTLDKPGICYIFCNVHPEMSGVIVVLDTPYYGVSDSKGEFLIREIPAGRYWLSAWHERGKPEAATDVPRAITVSVDSAVLAPIRLRVTANLLVPHKNKYGRDYDPPAPSGLVYK